MSRQKAESSHFAFPHQFEDVHGHPAWHQSNGMTLRDWFAGQALANSSICRHDDEYPQKTAYAFADAMLKERKE